MGRASSQQFITRNRKPRTHITYEVEKGNAMSAIELPFVMGVFADLSGKSEVEMPAPGDRKFQEFDVDNFDQRMKAIKPKVQFTVPNVLSGDGGNVPVDLTFESMDDFSPAAIARKVDALNRLLQVREQLNNLGTFIDVNDKVEGAVAKLLSDPALMRAIAAGAQSGSGGETPEKE